MKNTIILVSGMPGTGKTSFANWLSSEIRTPLVSYDNVVENYIKLSGEDFDNLTAEERRHHGHIMFGFFWYFCEAIMKSSSPIILEYFFINKMKEDSINGLVEKYKYQAVNVHMDTSTDVAHHRFHERNQNNPGIKGMRPKEIPYEKFVSGTKDCKDFRYGDRIVYVDTTDFTKVSYEDILKQIHKYAGTL